MKIPGWRGGEAEAGWRHLKLEIWRFGDLEICDLWIW
jgi:hypothetical protein